MLLPWGLLVVSNSVHSVLAIEETTTGPRNEARLKLSGGLSIAETSQCPTLPSPQFHKVTRWRIQNVEEMAISCYWRNCMRIIECNTLKLKALNSFPMYKLWVDFTHVCCNNFNYTINKYLRIETRQVICKHWSLPRQW